MPSDRPFPTADEAAAIAARFAARGGQPGLAYGLVADGQLVLAGGCGERWTGGPVPDADTVFRIASMSKSFTASMILLLRDQGFLRLDDAATSYVPELGGVPLPAGDCPPITIRHLLTMTAGFPTDDPWGDRQQGLDPAEFARLLSTGSLRTAWAPGTRFEYSNIGYAILGRVIAAVTGEEYAAVIRARLLEPLDLRRTGYAAGEFDPAELARGYRRDGTGWLELPMDPYGAFAPMGGVFSTVRDLARWVAGFADAFPARESGAADADHPLSRATRREMQLGQVAIPAGDSGVVASLTGPLAMSYGFGLFTEDDADFGTIVQHSGGYPGFGSQMRWHPATGMGAIVLANGTYAAAGALASQLLAAALRVARPAGAASRAGRQHGPVPAPGAPWPETVSARAAVDALLDAWDDAAAERLFTPNVELDRPLAERRGDIDLLRDRIGAFRPDTGRLAEYESPAHCRWWLTGERGTVAVQIKLAPLRERLVQQLVVALPPEPASPLAEVLAAIVATINSGAAEWAADVPVAEGLTPVGALRLLRLAAAWTGSCGIDCYLAGNGRTTATVRLAGPSGTAVIAAEIAGADGPLSTLTVSLAR